MRRRLGVTLGLVGTGVLALVIAEVATSGHQLPSRRAAPPLPTAVLMGSRVDLAQLRGRPAVVSFWASWCAPCEREAGALEQVSRSLAGRATVVGIDWSDAVGGARHFIRRHGWTFTVLRDPDGVAGERYDLTGLPTTFVLDRGGRIAVTLRGPQSVPSLLRAVELASA